MSIWLWGRRRPGGRALYSFSGVIPLLFLMLVVGMLVLSLMRSWR